MLNPTDHSYTGLITGLPRRSVTTVLAEEGWIDKRWYREGFQDLGTQVHALLHAHDKGWKFTAPNIYLRYVAPWQAFLKHTGVEIVDSEVEGEDVLLGVSGTLDKIALHPRDGHGIIDIKVSSCGWLAWHEYQSEAYRQMLVWHPKYKDLEIKWRAGIILGPSCEMPKLIPHNRIKDIDKKWRAICIAHHAKIESKIEFEEISEDNGWIA